MKLWRVYKTKRIAEVESADWKKAKIKITIKRRKNGRYGVYFG